MSLFNGYQTLRGNLYALNTKSTSVKLEISVNKYFRKYEMKLHDDLQCLESSTNVDRRNKRKVLKNNLIIFLFCPVKPENDNMIRQKLKIKITWMYFSTGSTRVRQSQLIRDKLNVHNHSHIKSRFVLSKHI